MNHDVAIAAQIHTDPRSNVMRIHGFVRMMTRARTTAAASTPIAKMLAVATTVKTTMMRVRAVTMGEIVRQVTSDMWSAPDRNRTCDLWYRKPTLYPLSYGGVPIEGITDGASATPPVGPDRG